MGQGGGGVQEDVPTIWTGLSLDETTNHLTMGPRSMDASINELLKKWLVVAEAADNAISAKDIKKLLACRKEGGRCFNGVRKYIDQLGGRVRDDDSRVSIQEAIDRWGLIVKKLVEFENDLKTRIDRVKRKRTVNKKIAGAYGKKVGGAGLNFRIKAR